MLFVWISASKKPFVSPIFRLTSKELDHLVVDNTATFQMQLDTDSSYELP